MAPCITMTTSVSVGLDNAVDVGGPLSVAVTNCVYMVVSMVMSMSMDVSMIVAVTMAVAVIKTVAVTVIVTVGAVVAVGSVTVIIRAGNSTAVLSSDEVVLDNNSFNGSGFRSVTLVKAAIAEFVSTVAD